MKAKFIPIEVANQPDAIKLYGSWIIPTEQGESIFDYELRKQRILPSLLNKQEEGYSTEVRLAINDLSPDQGIKEEVSK